MNCLCSCAASSRALHEKDPRGPRGAPAGAKREQDQPDRSLFCSPTSAKSVHRRDGHHGSQLGLGLLLHRGTPGVARAMPSGVSRGCSRNVSARLRRWNGLGCYSLLFEDFDSCTPWARVNLLCFPLPIPSPSRYPSFSLAATG